MTFVLTKYSEKVALVRFVVKRREANRLRRRSSPVDPRMQDHLV